MLAAELPGLGVDLSRPFTIEAFVTQNRAVDLKGGLWPALIYEMNRVSLSNGDRWRFKVIGGRDGELAHIIEGPPIDDGQQVHLAGVFTGTQIRLFVNGVLAGARDVSTDPPAKVKTDLKIGFGFDGTVREVRVSDVARYDKGVFTPALRFQTDEHTLGLFHCDEGQGETLNDSSGHERHGKIFGTRARWGSPQ
jgi:hypothetical protein